MNGVKTIVKRRSRAGVSRTVLMITVFAVMISTLFSVFSLSIAYAKNFVVTAEELNEDPYDLFKEGVWNVSEFTVFLARQLRKPLSRDVDANAPEP